MLAKNIKNLYKIHGIYLDNKRQNINKSITFDDVNNFFKKLDVLNKCII